MKGEAEPEGEVTDGAASGYSPPEGAGEDKPLTVELLKEKELLETESGTFTVAQELVALLVHGPICYWRTSVLNCKLFLKLKVYSSSSALFCNMYVTILIMRSVQYFTCLET